MKIDTVNIRRGGTIADALTQLREDYWLKIYYESSRSDEIQDVEIEPERVRYKDGEFLVDGNRADHQRMRWKGESLYSAGSHHPFTGSPIEIEIHDSKP